MKPRLPLVGVCLGIALHPVGLWAATLAGADAPATSMGNSTVELARGGGGRGGAGRAGGSVRGGGSRRSGGNTGFATYGGGGSSFRGSQRPAGGWSSDAVRGAQRSGSRQISGSSPSSRQDNRTVRSIDRQANRTDRTSERQGNRSDRVSDRTNLRSDRLDNRWDNHWAGWARPGWGYARPWATGWYGSSAGWGWWASRPVGWGVAALATGTAIAALVDESIENESTYILVPDTSYELYYTSVQPSGADGVDFAVNTNSGVLEMTADCRSGTLNGSVPQSAAEAQLLNAVCVITYGSAT